ncbi:membrane protein [Fulvitalea axinellae]|uniref:Membrane protein n=1 Tax=Fulvitalea axinellae TaxID=1182444 RepID=A0AAU9CDL7_9BACT|nr:membrane protein [Fulvitalea axinellae]
MEEQVTKKRGDSLSLLFREYILITVGVVLAALGITAFFAPAQISYGGLTGISLLAYFATGIPIWIPYILINIVIVITGFFTLGSRLATKTVYTIVLYAISLSILQHHFSGRIAQDTLINALAGGVLNGAGFALVFLQNGALGGIGIISMVVHKYTGICYARIMFGFRALVLFGTYFVFQSFEAVLYALIAIFVSTYTMDYVLTGFRGTLQLFIFSPHYKKISEDLKSQYSENVSLLPTESWFSEEGERSQLLMVVVTKDQYGAVKNIVKSHDESAHIVVSPVSGKMGK